MPGLTQAKTLHVTHFETALHMVAAGAGYLQLPALVALANRDKLSNVIFKSTREHDVRRIALIHRKGDSPDPVALSLAATWQSQLVATFNALG